MKKTKYRRLAAMAASLLCCLIFTVPAYAQSSEPQPETAPAPAETEAEPETQNPFTPDGTGTVVDNATDEDGKEFYTITTADESVFYLVIDKQKTSENVYFLNTVTTDDLLPLAEQGKEPPKEVTPAFDTGIPAHPNIKTKESGRSIAVRNEGLFLTQLHFQSVPDKIREFCLNRFAFLSCPIDCNQKVICIANIFQSLIGTRFCRCPK